MTEFLENEIQRKIYDLIAKDPGLHLSKIAEMLNMKLTEVAYHLQYLEKKEIITFSEKEGCTGYFIKKSKELSLSDRRSREIRMELFNLISDNPGLHLSKIAETLNINLSLAKYHLLFILWKISTIICILLITPFKILLVFIDYAE